MINKTPPSGKPLDSPDSIKGEQHLSPNPLKERNAYDQIPETFNSSNGSAFLKNSTSTVFHKSEMTTTVITETKKTEITEIISKNPETGVGPKQEPGNDVKKNKIFTFFTFIFHLIRSWFKIRGWFNW